MLRLISQITSPTALLYFFLVVTRIIAGIYTASGTEQPRAYLLLYPLSFLWILGLWLQKDSRKNGAPWVFDMGFFLYQAWLIIMPYYLYKTRGGKAYPPIFAFIGIYIGADLIGQAIYALFSS
jgi:hypothetical protein